MNEITIGDKVYISAKRAAEITGYARDYVGQLSREGHVDAKMVGRSWYVYEPSIRAHRFGGDAGVATEEPQEAEIPAEAPVAAPELPQAPAPKPFAAWEQPKYTPEPPQMIPEIPAATYEELLPPAEQTITDMQAAWREWFERKQQSFETPELESPEVIEAREEAHMEEEVAGPAPEEEPQEVEEVAIPLHKIEEEPEEVPVIARTMPEPEAEPVVLHREVPVEARYQPVYEAPQARIVHERIITRKGSRRRSNAPTIALLVGVSVISIAIAAIGSGIASRYFATATLDNPILNILVGTREFSR